MQTLLRHFITALGGVLLVDTSNTQSLVFGLIVIGCAWLWSVIQKLDWNGHVQIRDDYKELLKKMGAALVSQGLAALSGWMMEKGFLGDVNDPAAVLLFFGNYGASRLGWHQKALGVKPVMLLALCTLLPALSACSSFTQDDAKIAGERIGLAAGDTAIFLARMQLAHAEADLAAAQHGGSNGEVRILVAKQLGVVAARQALDAAERAIAKQRAKLDAKQPINVQPSAERPISQSTPLQVSKSPKFTIPDYAPRVVASLETRTHWVWPWERTGGLFH